MSIGHGALRLGIRGNPLPRTGRALGQLPVVRVQIVEKSVVPLRRLVGPSSFQPTGDRVAALASSVAVVPTEALLLEGSTLGFRTDVVRRGRTMSLADRVAADDERNRFLVVHRHATERLSNVPGGRQRIRVAARPLRVHIDQTHLHGAERTSPLPGPAVALISEPSVLRAPENLLGLPDILSSEAEAKCLEPHRFIGTVAGEDDQIGPRDLAAVLLLDRPEQPARLVQARVVGPTVEGGEALSAAAATAPAIGDAVRTSGMPTHSDEEPTVVAVVGRPPVLRRRHQLEDVPLQRVDVEGLELFRVVEVLAHRVGPARVMVENLQVGLIRPPVPIRLGPSRLRSRGGKYWAFAFAATVRHVGPSFILFSDWSTPDRGLVQRCVVLVTGVSECGEATLSEQPPNKQPETGIVILYHGCHKNECRTIRSGDLGMNEYSILRYSSGCGERTGDATGQRLPVIEGLGRAQARGGGVITVRPGHNVYTLPGELQCMARHPTTS